MTDNTDWEMHLKAAIAAAQAPLQPSMPVNLQPKPLHMSRQVQADPAQANRAIHAALAAGARGIMLQLAAPGQPGLPMRYDAIAAALADIDLGQSAIALDAGDQYIGACQCVTALWDAQGVSRPARLGGTMADPLGTLARTGALEAGLWSTLDVMGAVVASLLDELPNATLVLADSRPYHEAGAVPAVELGLMLATLAEYHKVLTLEGLKPHFIRQALGLAVAVDHDVTANVAKLRAARALVARLMDGNSVPVHVTTSIRMLAGLTPGQAALANLLAAAAASGSADTLTVLPHSWRHGMGEAFAERLALASAIQAEQVDTVVEGAALDQATTLLTEAAWLEYERIDALGGMASALLEGTLRPYLRAQMPAQPLLSAWPDWLHLVELPAPALMPHPAITPIETAETRIEPLLRQM